MPKAQPTTLRKGTGTTAGSYPDLSEAGCSLERNENNPRKRVRSDNECDAYDDFKSEMRDLLSSMFSKFTNTQNERMKAIEK